MEHVFTILHQISPLGVFDHMGMLSYTDLVVIFLASKGVFAIFAAAIICTPLRQRASLALSGPDTAPERLLPS